MVRCSGCQCRELRLCPPRLLLHRHRLDGPDPETRTVSEQYLSPNKARGTCEQTLCLLKLTDMATQLPLLVEGDLGGAPGRVEGAWGLQQLLLVQP